jgi:hypothetical protein
VLAYAVLYLGCVLAYEPLGIEPADVGLGYAELLAGSAAGGVLLAYTFLVLVVVFFYLQWRIKRWERTGIEAPPRRITKRFYVVVAGVALFGVAYIIVFALLAAGNVQDGQRPPRLFGIPFPWDAKVAEVQWLTETPPASPRQSPLRPLTLPQGTTLPECLLYLGQSSNTRFFYDHEADESVGLPAANTAVMITDEEEC